MPQVIRNAVLVVLLLTAASAKAIGPASQPATQSAAKGYLGVALADLADGQTAFSWFFPGPLKGQGLSAPSVDLARPDLLVSVDGQAMKAADFQKYIASRPPGTQVTLRYRRSRNRGGAMPQVTDHEPEVRTLSVSVDSAEAWAGTVGQPRRSSTRVQYAGARFLDPRDPANELGKAIAAQGLAEPVEALGGVFAQFRDAASDRHQLSRVLAGFDDPFRLPELGTLLAEPTKGVAADPFATAARMIRENLDADPRASGGAPSTRPATVPLRIGTETAEEAAVRAALANAASNVSASLPEVADREAFAAHCAALLRVPRSSFYIAGPQAQQHLAVIRQSTSFEPEHIARSIEALAPLGGLTATNLASLPPVDPPPELAGAVQGKILAASHGAQGWVVAGSAENNRYDLAKLAGVIDVGGNDQYTASGWCVGSRVVIDFAGDDLYSGTADQGPGSALMGVTLIDDRAGNDDYAGGLLAGGAAMYGAALLIDRAGHDTYAGTDWSLGAGFYGAGLLFDLGGGSDTYLGEFLCQGVGGPGGMGAIIDDGGADLYRANGPQRSGYGTPAVYNSFSQGVGFGYRHYATGGIGLIADLGGDDRYEAGEFAQGGGYYFALGMVYDASGRDLYYGNRYGQGFGVHQGFGILMDDSGNDTYWGMTAASQGAAWDVGAGLLIDRAGDDTYRADGLAQGGASMQGIALLIDLGGRDGYDAINSASQGQSGGNEYHFTKGGARSFSLLMDLGGAEDSYSTGRPNNSVTRTGGEAGGDAPAAAPLHGLVIDR